MDSEDADAPRDHPQPGTAPAGGAAGHSLFEYARLAGGVGLPFPLDYGEGPMLDQTLRLAQFENIYRNSFASPPYTVSNTALVPIDPGPLPGSLDRRSGMVA